MKKHITLNGEKLHLRDISRVLIESDVQVSISQNAMKKIVASRVVIEKAVEEDAPVYGVNTGFGKLSSVRIPKDQLLNLQRNLILSHATAVGEPLDALTTKIILLLRLNSLVKGYSGVTPLLVETMAEMFNKGVLPIIPSQGSVGASGDLGPLSHLALVIMGQGEALYKGHRMSGVTAMQKAGIKPIELQPKEGLALINGTQVMSAILCITLIGAKRLMRHADIASAMTIEALKGTNTAFDKRIQDVRPHPHQALCASNMRKLLNKSWIMASHVDCSKVQDPYSLRCSPQVHGASRAAIAHVDDSLSIEINSATDNPLIFTEENEILSGGNFHGQPIALVADYLGIAIAELASISERRIENLVNPELSGLPAFLAPKEGLDSGYMIAQVTAASLVSENKILAHPASVDSIPNQAPLQTRKTMSAWEPPERERPHGFLEMQSMCWRSRCYAQRRASNI